MPIVNHRTIPRRLRTRYLIAERIDRGSFCLSILERSNSIMAPIRSKLCCTRSIRGLFPDFGFPLTHPVVHLSLLDLRFILLFQNASSGHG